MTSGPPGTRATVLAIPGLLCDEFVWRAQADALADIADVVIADASRHDDLVDMARSALADLDGRLGPWSGGGVAAIDVVGHSMGGRVAFEVWRLAPERVRSLVVLDTGVHGPLEGESEKRQRLLDVSASQGMQALADEWLPPMVHPDRRSDHSLMEPLIEMVLRATPELHARQIAALLSRPDKTDVLATITVPTLVIVGRDDEWSPLAQHEMIAAAVRGAHLDVVDDAGHMVTVERPDAVTALLRDWLTRR